jgi:hypothetical protein
VTVFRCVRCNQELTRDLALLAVFPERPEPIEREIASATVRVGHYALDPEPFGALLVPNDDPRAPVPAMANMSRWPGRGLRQLDPVLKDRAWRWGTTGCGVASSVQTTYAVAGTRDSRPAIHTASPLRAMLWDALSSA